MKNPSLRSTPDSAGFATVAIRSLPWGSFYDTSQYLCNSRYHRDRDRPSKWSVRDGEKRMVQIYPEVGKVSAGGSSHFLQFKLVPTYWSRPATVSTHGRFVNGG